MLKFDQENARHAGAIRVTLAAVGTPIGPDDVLIAGQAWARKLIAVTHNTPAFAAVDGPCGSTTAKSDGAPDSLYGHSS